MTQQHLGDSRSQNFNLERETMTTVEQISLTNLSSAGGCGCKLDPTALQNLLCSINKYEQKELIIGFDTADDCAVYEYGPDDYLLCTTDFFTPLVDDPYTYGVLTAANALSDVYAMGGKPLIATVILGYPTDTLTPSVVQRIMQGGQDTMKKAQCTIVGGHTIVNPQPIYGFSIIGRVEKQNLKPNCSAKVGDLLVLTKPIGSGILSNAMKLGLLTDGLYQQLRTFLIEVNSSGYELGKVPHVRALTDVTGFGLVGHALEMAQGACLSLEIQADRVHIFDGVAELCAAVLSPNSGAIRNKRAYEDKMTFEGMWSLEERYIFCDPQSNGGLLIAVDSVGLEQVQRILTSTIGRPGDVIGRFSEGTAGRPPLVVKK